MFHEKWKTKISSDKNYFYTLQMLTYQIQVKNVGLLGAVKVVTAIPFVDQEQRVVGKVTMILQSALVAVMGYTVVQEKTLMGCQGQVWSEGPEHYKPTCRFVLELIALEKAKTFVLKLEPLLKCNYAILETKSSGTN